MPRRPTPFFAYLLSLVVTVGCSFNSLLDKSRCTTCYESSEAPTPGLAALSIEEPCLEERCIDPWREPLSPMDLSEESITESQTLKLSLDECIQLALANSPVLRDLGGTAIRNPEAAGTRYAPALAYTDPRFGQEAALSDFDATLEASAIFENNDRGFNNSFVGDNGVLKQDLHTYQWGISKRSATGGLYSLSHNTVYDNNNQLSNRLGPSTFDTFLQAEVRHPLFQGAGTRFNRIAGPNAQPGVINGVLIARTRQDISLAELERNVRDVVANVENAYWDLYFAYRDLEAKIDVRDQALQVKQIEEAIAETGGDPTAMAGGDAAQAREQYYRFQAEVVDALSGRPVIGTRTNNGTTGGTFRGVGGLRVAERRLRLMVGMPINDGRLIRPSDEPFSSRVTYDWNSAISEAMVSRVELRRQRWVIKQRELELIANRNFLKPRADLVGRYRWRGFGDQLISQGSTSNAAESLTSGEFQEWQAGVELLMPVGFRRAHAGVRNSQLAAAKARALLREQERQVHFGLSNAFSEVRRAYDNRQLQQERLAATREQIKMLKDRRESGVVDVPLDVLLEAQRRLLDIRLSYHRAEVEYALALRNLQLEKGTLLEYCSVSLSESQSDPGAYRDAAERQRLRGKPHSPGHRDPVAEVPSP